MHERGRDTEPTQTSWWARVLSFFRAGKRAKAPRSDEPTTQIIDVAKDAAPCAPEHGSVADPSLQVAHAGMARDNVADVARQTPAEAAELPATIEATEEQPERGICDEHNDAPAESQPAKAPVKEYVRIFDTTTAESGPEADTTHEAAEAGDTPVDARKRAENTKDDHTQSIEATQGASELPAAEGEAVGHDPHGADLQDTVQEDLSNESPTEEHMVDPGEKNLDAVPQESLADSESDEVSEGPGDSTYEGPKEESRAGLAEKDPEEGSGEDREEDSDEDLDEDSEEDLKEDSEEDPEGGFEEKLEDPDEHTDEDLEEEPEADVAEKDLEEGSEEDREDYDEGLEEGSEEDPEDGFEELEKEGPDEHPDEWPTRVTPSDADSDEVIVIDDSDEAPCGPPPPPLTPCPMPTDALSRYLASRRPTALPRRTSRFRPVYATGALKVPAPEPIRPGRSRGAGPLPRRSRSSLSQRRKAPLAMAEFRAGLQARQQARIAAMVRDAFHTLRGARTRGTWEDFQALVRKRAHVQQLLDLETLRTHPRTPVLDEAEYTKRTLAALQEREACARARLPERLVPVEAQRQAVQEAKARRRATHGILGRAVLPSALPARAEAQVQQVLVQRGVIASMTGAQVEAHDIAKLRPGQWLNDEVINFYGQLIQQRANQAAPQPGDASPCWAVHVFSSFFWQNLTTRGYAGVRRWSRRVDLFTKDVVLMPINLGQAHWVCAAIDLRLRRFAYYDSMGMPSPAVLQRLRAYLADELKDKHGLALYLDDWEDYCAGDTSPQQSNGYDCGVFAAQTLEQLSRRDPGVPYPPRLEAGAFAQRADPQALALLREEYAGEYAWNFSQRDMPYLRRRMAYEIATKQLLA